MSELTAKWKHPRRAGGLVAFLVLEVFFLAQFNRGLFQPLVDLSWLLAVVAYAVAFWEPDANPVPRVHQPYWFYALYFALLLPFAEDWRWTFAADNMSWPLNGLIVRELGPQQSLLSVNGPDNFGYLQSNLHNLFMLVIKPDIFWHRVGKIFIGMLALAASYTAFARLAHERFAMLVAGCAAICSVTLVYTYASVPFMDGLASAYTLLAIGLRLQKNLTSRPSWLLLGLLSGFMLYLTPNGWLMVPIVWGWLAVALLRSRTSLVSPIVAGIGGFFTGLPVLLQWSHGEGGQLFSLVQNPGWTVEKVRAFLTEAATIPFSSGQTGAGAFGPQLPPGFRWLFVVGFLLALVLPAKRMPAGRFIAAIFSLHVFVLAFAQGPYAGVSVKRALILIPMATYLVFLPFQQWLRSIPLILAIIGVWAISPIHDLLYEMHPGRTGYNLFDGAVEAHQRFAPATICLYLPNNERSKFFIPGTDVDRVYHLSDRLRPVTDLNDPACKDAMCFCSEAACEHVDFAAYGYTEVPMMNSIELRCGRRLVGS